MSEKYVYLRSLGCPKNEADAEVMLHNLLQHPGYRLTRDPMQADILLVNTCGFILDAANESVDAILELARYKTEGKASLLAVTGCLSQRYGADLQQELPEVDVMLGVSQYPYLHEYLQQATPVLDLQARPFLSQTAGRVLEHRSYAYLKIAEGCDNYCTYCTIPRIKGRYISREAAHVVEEAKYLADQGVAELVLVAQDTTRFGMERGKSELVPLLKDLTRVSGIERIRLLYCYPELVDEALLETVAGEAKIASYLDIPLQHVDDAVLRRMGRRSSEAQVRALIERIRTRYSDIALRTTFIVGFPGEDRKAFQNLLRFCAEARFENMGAFRYSAEEDTPAATMADQVTPRTKAARLDRLMLQQQAISRDYLQQYVGKTLPVLVDENRGDGSYSARAAFQAPSIDGTVIVRGKGLRIGRMADVEITRSDLYDLEGVCR